MTTPIPRSDEHLKDDDVVVGGDELQLKESEGEDDVPGGDDGVAQTGFPLEAVSNPLSVL